jgi:hypothetical protein
VFITYLLKIITCQREQTYFKSHISDFSTFIVQLKYIEILRNL